MNNPMWQAFRESGLVGQAIVLILFVLSIAVWTVAASKFFILFKVRRSNLDFLNRFHFPGRRLPLPDSSPPSLLLNPLPYLYWIGKKAVAAAEVEDNPGGGLNPEQREKIASELRQHARQYLEALGKNQIILATSGSVSPLLGILGTIWGVLIAFQEMGRSGNAGIEIVGPGMSEALITTVAGLVVAIPALAFYNYFNHTFDHLAGQMESFIEDFIERGAREKSETGGNQPTLPDNKSRRSI